MQVAVRWRSKNDKALGHFALFTARPVEVDDDFRIGARQRRLEADHHKRGLTPIIPITYHSLATVAPGSYFKIR